jgi:hypothetical protein
LEPSLMTIRRAVRNLLPDMSVTVWVSMRPSYGSCKLP